MLKQIGLPFSPYLKRRDQIKIVKLIRDFFNQGGKLMKICIVGGGYVGISLATMLSKIIK